MENEDRKLDQAYTGNFWILIYGYSLILTAFSNENKHIRLID